MKKSLFTLLVMVVCLMGCHKQARTDKQTNIDKQANIEGIIAPELGIDSAQVTLTVISQGVEKEIVTTCQDGRFVFNENADEPYLTTLNIEGLDPMPIYIEKGKTELKIGVEGVEYVGTPNNTVLSAFMQLLDDEEAIEPAFQLALDNAKLLVGKNIFLDIYYLLSTEQLGQFLSRLSDEEKLNGKGKIPRVAKMYNALVATDTGKTYTDIALPTPDGNTLAISDLVGQKDYLLLDFWASWCGPCRQSMPVMKEIYAQHNDRLEVLGISLDDDREAWLNAIDKLGLPWKHISDLGGWDNAAAEKYGVMFIPTTVLISRDGKIIGRNLNEDELVEILNH